MTFYFLCIHMMTMTSQPLQETSISRKINHAELLFLGCSKSGAIIFGSLKEAIKEKSCPITLI